MATSLHWYRAFRRKLSGSGNMRPAWRFGLHGGNSTMNSVIYLIGLVVVVLAILSFFGFH
ncbi:hypothetical protein EJ077_08225 [Mesorhizobium sp. M8A.F.Ca.ET.057.01.1.1]|nr:hypothetical protein EJ077_08225 [Mesorhizobium sp. M8A.F.Ca.ET.057.01.1.1]